MTTCRIATAHGRFIGIRQMAPVCTPPNARFLGPTRLHIPNGISIASAISTGPPNNPGFNQSRLHLRTQYLLRCGLMRDVIERFADFIAVCYCLALIHFQQYIAISLYLLMCHLNDKKSSVTFVLVTGIHLRQL